MQAEIKGGIKKEIAMTLNKRKSKTNDGAAKGVKTVERQDGEKLNQTDIEGQKALIQSVTQATNPLGKIVEMVDDDLESMNKEYDSWTKVYIASKEKMKDKEREIEGELQALNDKITSKDEQIKERKAQIEAVKTQILRNSKKIEKLLNDIVGSK